MPLPHCCARSTVSLHFLCCSLSAAHVVQVTERAALRSAVAAANAKTSHYGLVIVLLVSSAQLSQQRDPREVGRWAVSAG